MSKYLSPFIILAVILVGLMYFKHLGISSDADGVQLSKSVRMVSIATSTDYTIMKGSYPTFTSASLAFNDEIKNAVNKGMAEHYKNSKENWRARFETASQDDHISEFPKDDEKFEYNASTTIIRNDDGVISLVIRIYQYTGGAHGMESIFTFNYDLKKQKDITLQDLKQSDQNFLKKLSALSRTVLVKQMADAAQIKPEEVNVSMLNDGTTPTDNNFSLFTLPNDKQATFYFTQYQVAAYAFGSQAITVDLPLK